MKESLKIAGAFIGVIVGAGFASGFELLRFFVDFGLWGLAGTLVSAILFTFFGMALARLGSRLNAVSHKAVVYAICGRYLGFCVDALITFFMYGVTVVMFAGGGALLEQQFGIPAIAGSIFVAVMVTAVVCLEAQKVVFAVGAVTPFLLVVAIIISGYTFASQDMSLLQLHQFADSGRALAPNWLFGAALYVSYNFVAGAPFLAIMGGLSSREKTAIWGGLLGGAGLGCLMLIMATGLLSRLNEVADLPMPMLYLANEMSPALGLLMTIIIFLMIINTAVGMLYSFLVRILPVGMPSFRVGAVISGVLGLIGSMVGFTGLVGLLYPILGYLGFILMLAVLIGWLRIDRIGTTKTGS